MSSILIHLRGGKEITVSADQQFTEDDVAQVLASSPVWRVTKVDGARVVIPTAAVEYVTMARSRPEISVVPSGDGRTVPR